MRRPRAGSSVHRTRPHVEAAAFPRRRSGHRRRPGIVPAHALQTEAALASSLAGVRRSPGSATSTNSPGSCDGPGRTLCAAGVLEHIGQRLLHDSVCGQSDGRGHLDRSGRVVIPRRPAWTSGRGVRGSRPARAAGGGRCGQCGPRGGERRRGWRGRAQHAEHLPQLPRVCRAVSWTAPIASLAPAGSRDRLVGGGGLHQRLTVTGMRHHVVQVLGDSKPPSSTARSTNSARLCTAVARRLAQLSINSRRAQRPPADQAPPVRIAIHARLAGRGCPAARARTASARCSRRPGPGGLANRPPVGDRHGQGETETTSAMKLSCTHPDVSGNQGSGVAGEKGRPGKRFMASTAPARTTTVTAVQSGCRGRPRPGLREPARQG